MIHTRKFKKKNNFQQENHIKCQVWICLDIENVNGSNALNKIYKLQLCIDI